MTAPSVAPLTEAVTWIHILRVPMKEIAAFSEGERYCFICRKRRPFMQIVNVPREMGSYYGPHRHIQCCVCGTEDGDQFPGTGGYYRFGNE